MHPDKFTLTQPSNPALTPVAASFLLQRVAELKTRQDEARRERGKLGEQSRTTRAFRNQADWLIAVDRCATTFAIQARMCVDPPQVSSLETGI